LARQVYVISDLHLGGDPPNSSDPDDRGFRICTHVPELTAFVLALANKPAPIELVINGDLVDFLAERDDPAAAAPWAPFVGDPQAAASRLEKMIARDRPLFDALATLLGKGHRLTLLLGNHDIELALPQVRRTLTTALGAAGRGLQFFYDGEAYPIGRVLIEHGNRYDWFNIVDHGALRRFRSMISRNLELEAEDLFEAPAGSLMVADVINPMKEKYRFVDLLKPETGAVVPLLLALEPGCRRKLTRVAELSLAARKHRMTSAARPSWSGDISGSVAELSGSYGRDIAASSVVPRAPIMTAVVDAWAHVKMAGEIVEQEVTVDPLEAVLKDVMPNPDVVLNLEADSAAGFGMDVSLRETINWSLGVLRLLTTGTSTDLDRRLPALLAAFRTLQNDETFDRSCECYSEYEKAALELSLGGFDCIVFGHTHLARDMWLTGGARYLNSGTWADLIKVPTDIIAGSDEQALAALRAFVNDMQQGKLSGWTTFTPTYIRLDFDDQDNLQRAALCDYSGPVTL
jgi:UDP-2,3-diacylglucosamine pyrophosphatase LpxH